MNELGKTPTYPLVEKGVGESRSIKYDLLFTAGNHTLTLVKNEII
jgi:hypothetical protein